VGAARSVIVGTPMVPAREGRAGARSVLGRYRLRGNQQRSQVRSIVRSQHTGVRVIDVLFMGAYHHFARIIRRRNKRDNRRRWGREGELGSRGKHPLLNFSLRVLRLYLQRLISCDSNFQRFVNKYGDPMNAKKWSEHNWKKPLKKLGIRHRKFYATRHTFITEAIKRGENLLAVAQYCGTSLTMIQKDYCGTLGLQLNRPQN
jgi:integrase